MSSFGVCRIVSKGGLKGVVGSKIYFKEFGPRAIIGTLSSWKGQFNMLLDATGVMSVREQVEYCEQNPTLGKKN